MLFLFIFLLPPPSLDCDGVRAAQVALPSIESEVASLRVTTLDEEQVTPLIEDYRELFKAKQPCLTLLASNEALEKRDLEQLFDLASRFVLEGGTEAGLHLALSAVEGLETRFGKGDRYAGYYGMLLLSLRRFEEAERFRAEWPGADFPEIPVILRQSPPPSEARTLYSPVPNGAALREEHVDMSGYTGMIMVGHPRCHFSARAMTAIEEEPALAASLAEHGLFITDTWSRLGDEAVVAWNEEMPRFAYRHPADGFAWPEVSYWGTPSFYFVRDGAVVHKVVGWPRDADEERRAALKEGLRAAGRD